MKVTNNSHKCMEVSVNTWGSGGSDKWYTLEEGQTGSWDRTDDRGYLLVASEDHAHIKTYTYYVRHNETVKLYEDGLAKNGQSKELKRLYTAVGSV